MGAAAGKRDHAQYFLCEELNGDSGEGIQGSMDRIIEGLVAMVRRPKQKRGVNMESIDG
jgi:hypothetical protein